MLRLHPVLVVLTACLLLTSCGGSTDENPPKTGPARAATADGSSPEALLRWIAAHPQSAGIAVLPAEGEPTLTARAEARFPLASTRKVLIAGALVAAHPDLTERVPRADVERWYAPGTDGGVHPQAKLDARRPSIGQIAQAMLTVSDNASADFLLHRVGPAAADAWGRAQGMRAQDPLYPLLGEYASWATDDGWATRTPQQRATAAVAQAEHTDPSAARGLAQRLKRVVPVARQRADAAASVAGTPLEWARLMRRIGTTGDPELIKLLDATRQSSEARARFAHQLFKGGSLPGVLTGAVWVEPKDGGPGAAATLFLKDLPPELQAQLTKTSAQLQLLVALATDPEAAAAAKRTLAG